MTTENNEVRSITKVVFGMLSPTVIEKMSACEITSYATKEEYGCLYDPRFGFSPTTPTKACVTCGLKKECQGHFGFIKLNYPILHPLHYKIIITYLKIFCKHCYKLLITKDYMNIHGLNKYKGKKKFAKIVKMIKDVDMTCPHDGCRARQYKIKTGKDLTIIKEIKQKQTNTVITDEIDSKEIQTIFNMISEEDLISIGINPENVHPKNFILTNFPVIPTCCRPPVFYNGTSGDDDLTLALSDIIKKNDALLKEDSEKKKKLFIEKVIELKNKIAIFYDNSKVKTSNSEKYTDMKDRLNGKEGRLRGSLNGKRVDFSARTVIGSGVELCMNQVEIPIFVSKILTFPEPVNQYNIVKLNKLVNKCCASSVYRCKEKDTMIPEYGLNVSATKLENFDVIIRGSYELEFDEKENVILPFNFNYLESELSEKHNLSETTKGLKDTRFLIETPKWSNILQKNDVVIRNNKVLTPIRYAGKRSMTLKIGDVVHRHLQNGDYVLFNRQPTLHRGGMLGMEVVISKNEAGKTFRFSPATTKIFNADYDGDEIICLFLTGRC